jgi:hypothetical protein
MVPFAGPATDSIRDGGHRDGNGMADGVLLLENIPAGPLPLRETTVPDGHSGAAPQTVTVLSGQTTVVELVHPRRAVLTIDVVSAAGGEPVPGAEIAILPADGADSAQGDVVLDGTNGDLDGVANGTEVTNRLDPGDYVATLYGNPPAGYLLGSRTSFALTRDDLTIAIELIPEARVVVDLTDPSGVPFSTGCFAVYHDDGTGARDLAQDPVRFGRCAALPFTIDRLEAGSYVLHQSQVPYPYLRAPDRPFTVAAGETLNLTLVNVPGEPLTIESVAADTGQFLPGSCFELVLVAAGTSIGTVCDGGVNDRDGTSNGVIVVGLPYVYWESYDLIQTAAPPGYDHAATQRLVRVPVNTVVRFVVPVAE